MTVDPPSVGDGGVAAGEVAVDDGVLGREIDKIASVPTAAAALL